MPSGLCLTGAGHITGVEVAVKLLAMLMTFVLLSSCASMDLNHLKVKLGKHKHIEYKMKF